MVWTPDSSRSWTPKGVRYATDTQNPVPAAHAAAVAR